MLRVPVQPKCLLPRRHLRSLTFLSGDPPRSAHAQGPPGSYDLLDAASLREAELAFNMIFTLEVSQSRTLVYRGPSPTVAPPRSSPSCDSCWRA